MATLYEQLGGEAAVNAAVDIFYRHVLSDDRVNYWFDGIDMDKQASKQKSLHDHGLRWSALLHR